MFLLTFRENDLIEDTIYENSKQVVLSDIILCLSLINAVTTVSDEKEVCHLQYNL